MKRSLIFVLLLTVLTAFPLAALAEKEETTLDEVVVTATRDAQEIRKIPASVTVITRQEIDRSNAQTVVDVMRTAPGVDVRDYYGTGKNASVDIRGFGETGLLNTLVLVDGRRVNEIDLSGVDWTQVPLDQIERIEIVRGAGSVLYGDNAMGGVVNIITKKPDKPFFARGEVTAGSYGLNRESFSAGGKLGAFSTILNASYSSTGGYRANGNLRAKDASGKLVYDVTDGVSLSLSAGLHMDDAGLPGGLTLKNIAEVGRNGTVNPFNHVSTDDHYTILGVKAKLWETGRIEADLSYRGRSFETYFDFSSPGFPYVYQDERSLATYGFTPKFIIDNPLGPFANKLTAGVDFYRSNSSVDARTTYDTSRFEGTKKTAGIYLLDEFSILPQLILSAGFREEWVNYDFSQSSRFAPSAEVKADAHEPAFNVALNYLFAQKSNAFISVKRSFRFPVTDEFIFVYPSLGLNSMEPQTAYQYEAGVRHVFTDWLEANLTVFLMDLQDEIFYNPATFSNMNYPGKTRRQGVETGVRVKPCPWFTLWGNYSYTQAELRGSLYSGNDIPAVPRHKGSVGADFSFGKGLTLDARANFVGTRHLISDWANQVDKLDSCYTVEARLAYAWKGLKAFVGVNNITNQKYSDFGVTNASGSTQLFYPSPERNFVAGLTYTF